VESRRDAHGVEAADWKGSEVLRSTHFEAEARGPCSRQGDAFWQGIDSDYFGTELAGHPLGEASRAAADVENAVPSHEVEKPGEPLAALELLIA